MLGVMFVAFLLQIVFRYVLNWPTGWTNELSTVLWIWAGALGRRLRAARGRGNPLRPVLRRRRARRARRAHDCLISGIGLLAALWRLVASQSLIM
jgi:TRAP-type C4-dicarboxylate transport system permease small subunit